MFSTTSSAPGTTTNTSTHANPNTSDDHYYTNQEVRILHDVVARAQVIFDRLPESERIATNALWKACDEVSDEAGVNYFDASRHMSKVIFYVGGQRGPGSLLDKFRDIMWRRYGIELQFDHHQDDDSEEGEEGSEDGGGDDGVGGGGGGGGRGEAYAQGRGTGRAFERDRNDYGRHHDDEAEERRRARGVVADNDDDEETERGHGFGAQHGYRDLGRRDVQQAALPYGDGVIAPPHTIHTLQPTRSNLESQALVGPAGLPFAHLGYGMGIGAGAGLRSVAAIMPPGPLADAPPSFEETDESPHTLESMQGPRVASDTTIQDLPSAATYKSTASVTGSTQPASFTLPPPLSYHPPSALRPLPVDYSAPYRVGSKKTVTFRSPTPSLESTRSIVHHDMPSPPRPPSRGRREIVEEEHDELQEEEEGGDEEEVEEEEEEEEEEEATEVMEQQQPPRQRQLPLDYDEIPEEDPVEQARRERRAERAHLILLTRTVLDRWCVFADEKAERTAVARRHMLRYKYFGAWHSVTRGTGRDEGEGEGDEGSSHSSEPGTVVPRDASASAPAVSHDLSDPNLTLPSWPPVGVDASTHWAFLEKTAQNWRDDRIRRTVLDQWRRCPASTERSLEDGQAMVWASVLGRCLTSWRDLANHEDRVSATTSDTIFKGQALQQWQPDRIAQDEARANAQFSRWLHGSVTHRSRDFLQSQPSPNGTVARQLGRPDSASFDVPSADAVQVACSEAMFENIMASRCLTLWAATLHHETEDRRQADDYRASIAAWVALGTWQKAQAQHALWEGWVQRGRWYLETTRVFYHWNGAAAEARKRREREIFAHLKKSRRARLAKRSLRLWGEFVGQTDDDAQFVERHRAGEDWAQLDEAVDVWQGWLSQHDEAEAASLHLFTQHSLSAWLEGHEEGRLQTELAQDAWGEQARSQSLTRWTLAQLQLNGRQRMVVDALEQNDRKLFRSAFDRWAEAAVQTPEQQQQQQQQGQVAQTPGTARRATGAAARLIGLRGRSSNVGGDGWLQNQNPRTPWTAPALPIRSRVVRHGRRQPPIMVAFEAGDPDEEEAELEREREREPLPAVQARTQTTQIQTQTQVQMRSQASVPAPARQPPVPVFSRSTAGAMQTTKTTTTPTATPRTPVFGHVSGLRGDGGGRGGTGRRSNLFQ